MKTASTPEDTARRLIALGYRRISNGFKLLARIDNPDWVHELASTLHCSPAALFLADGSGDPDPQWCDHYRRCYSKDRIAVSEEVYRLIPGSGHDGTGFVPKTQQKEPRMAIPTRPIPPAQAPIEVRLFTALEELARTMGVTTDQIRTCCNVLDMLTPQNAAGANAKEAE